MINDAWVCKLILLFSLSLPIRFLTLLSDRRITSQHARLCFVGPASRRHVILASESTTSRLRGVMVWLSRPLSIATGPTWSIGVTLVSDERENVSKQHSMSSTKSMVSPGSWIRKVWAFFDIKFPLSFHLPSVRRCFPHKFKKRHTLIYAKLASFELRNEPTLDDAFAY